MAAAETAPRPMYDTHWNRYHIIISTTVWIKLN
jgi:hypothetical protein